MYFYLSFPFHSVRTEVYSVCRSNFIAASKQIEHVHDVALRTVKVSVILIE